MRTTIPKRYKPYHIWNRGNHREPLGQDHEDYDTLFRLILYTFDVRNFDLICFCIMPNHFHILVAQTGHISISTALQKIELAYTKILNQRMARSGHLFQGRFSRKIVSDYDHFLRLTDYIINNPQKIRNLPSNLCVTKENYPWIYKNEMLDDYYKLTLYPFEPIVD